MDRSFNNWLKSFVIPNINKNSRRGERIRLRLEHLESRINPSFATAVNYTAGSSPAFVASADLNGDGKLDLVTANFASGTNTVSVLLGNGNGTFQAKQDFGTGTGPISVAIADLNGDGKLDLVTANLAFGSTPSASCWATATVPSKPNKTSARDLAPLP
jgi:16S rRNA G1207 methylase RsmC